MSAEFAFEPGFLSFAAGAGWVAQDEADVPVLSNQNGRGEIRYRVHADHEGRFMVARAERASEPEIVAITTDADIVHRYLTTTIGEAGRDMNDFLLLWNADPDTHEPADGYRVQPVEGTSWFTLIAPHNQAVPLQVRQFDAISYSFTAHASLPELYASFRDTHGHPALHGAWLRWQTRHTALTPPKGDE